MELVEQSSALTIVSGGSGYVGSAVTVSISAPKTIGVGVGTTASATIPVVNGALSGTANITNGGFGYSDPPQVLAPTANILFEDKPPIDIVQGGSGIVTGITTAQGTGGNGTLGIKFFLNAASNNEYSNFQNGYPIFIADTIVGRGATSINNAQDDAVVGVGTTFADNVYIVRNFSAAANAEFLADILSTTITTDIPATGFTTCGRFSWGRLAGISRSSLPISIGVTGLTFAGLSTYPTIQRRTFGHRDSGALRNDLG